MPNWDGKTERRATATDHDHVVRLLVMVESLVKTLEATRADLVIHEAEDNMKFTKILVRMGVGTGVLLTCQFAIGIYVAIRFH